jgi:hypothetical protein
MTYKLRPAAFGCALLLSVAVWRAQADQVEMQNGDRYSGKVLTLGADSVILQNEVLGKVKLPRDRVALVTFGTNMTAQVALRPLPTNAPVRAVPVLPTAESVADASALRQIAAHTNLIHRVEDQFLKDAGPEAKAKFEELLGGLANGKIDLNGLRAQAGEAVNQLKALERDGGDQGSGLLDGYAAILESFLKETAPPAGTPGTNAPAVSSVPNPRPGAE